MHEKKQLKEFRMQSTWKRKKNSAHGTANKFRNITNDPSKRNEISISMSFEINV